MKYLQGLPLTRLYFAIVSYSTACYVGNKTQQGMLFYKYNSQRGSPPWSGLLSYLRLLSYPIWKTLEEMLRGRNSITTASSDVSMTAYLILLMHVLFLPVIAHDIC